jgi:hypothetical protein
VIVLDHCISDIASLDAVGIAKMIALIIVELKRDVPCLLSGPRAKCIGRESNPGLAELSMIIDHEWQRPILPLNHQCIRRIDE